MADDPSPHGMSLQVRINLFLAVVMTGLWTVMLVAGIEAIDATSRTLYLRIMDMSLGNAFREVEAAHFVLVKTGNEYATDAMGIYQRRIARDLKRFRVGESGHVQILGGGRVVASSEPGGEVSAERGGEAAMADPALLAAIGKAPEGRFSLASPDGGERVHVFRTFTPWNWVVVLSIESREILSQGGTYIRTVSLILAGAFLVVGLAIHRSSRRHLRRLQDIVSLIRHVETGDQPAAIPPTACRDEIDILQENILPIILQRRRSMEELSEAHQRFLDIVNFLPDAPSWWTRIAGSSPGTGPWRK